MPNRLLIVDDEEDTLNLIKSILENQYQLSMASDGDGALKQVEEFLPDLILIDMVMPGKNGLEVCKILKSNKKTKHIPVIIFSVLNRDVDRKLAKDSGADGYFVKPFSVEKLRSEVQKQLENCRSRKFSIQLGVANEDIKGKKFLLSYDPSAPYERFVRDFVLGSIESDEKAVVISRYGSAVYKALENDGNVTLINFSLKTRVTPILQENPEGRLRLVYDNLTDLALSINTREAYNFARNTLELLKDDRITVMFLLNPDAHDRQYVYSLKGIFNNQLDYGKEGVTNIIIR